MTGGTTSRRARRRQTGAGVLGPARVAADAVAVAARLRPGDIAVIDHLDLDRSSAEALVAAGPAAVLNAARSISGRYPNLGPQVLVDAGVPLVDDLGPDVLSVPDGHVLRVADGAVYDGQTLLAEGDLQTRESVAEAMAAARGGLATQLQAFAANGMAYLRDEQALLLEGEGVPQLRTRIEGRPVLVVVPGPKAVDDLAAVRPFVREHRPVLLGVDGGADLLLAAGLRPDIVLGALDQVSERALTGGAELVVRVPRTGETPGVARLRRLDLAFVSYPAGGSAADAALLLAEARGAELVVGVGTRVGLGRVRTGEALDERLGQLVVGRRVGGGCRGQVAGQVADEALPERPHRRIGPRRGEGDVRDDLGPRLRQPRVDGLGHAVVDRAERHDGDAVARQGAAEQPGPGRVERGVGGALVGRGGVALLGQLRVLGRQRGVAAGDGVPDRVAQRAGAERDAARQREEHRDERDQVVAEVDHHQLPSNRPRTQPARSASRAPSAAYRS